MFVQVNLYTTRDNWIKKTAEPPELLMSYCYCSKLLKNKKKRKRDAFEFVWKLSRIKKDSFWKDSETLCVHIYLSDLFYLRTATRKFPSIR